MEFSKLPIKEQLVKRVVRSGNGGAVWVPKDWLGQEVVVILPQKPKLELFDLTSLVDRLNLALADQDETIELGEFERKAPKRNPFLYTH